MRDIFTIVDFFVFVLHFCTLQRWAIYIIIMTNFQEMGVMCLILAKSVYIDNF